jgi:hypothetical protein
VVFRWFLVRLKTTSRSKVVFAIPGSYGELYGVTECGTSTTTVVYPKCMTHDEEHIPLLRGTFRALPLERLKFVESRATDENFA